MGTPIAPPDSGIVIDPLRTDRPLGAVIASAIPAGLFDIEGREINVVAGNNIPSRTGTPGSTTALVNERGELIRQRDYGADGRAVRDIDFTDHGNPAMHPIVPHQHNWNWSTGNGIRDGQGMPVESPW